MKNFSLLLIFLLTSFFSFAQEFTPPDSAAIIKNHVKSVKVFYTGTGSKHLITQEYGYDKNGRKIYSHEGSVGYYYSFSYNEKGQVMGTFQRANSGDLLQGQKMDYYPNGKLFHRQIIYEHDTVHPGTICTYDTLENKIEENLYSNGKLTRTWKYRYSLDKKIIYSVDSTPGENAYESVNSKTTRQSYYNENNELIEKCIISYNDKGNLIKTVCTSGNKTNSYTVVYDDNSEIEFHVLKNGKPISKEEYVTWSSKFQWLMPRLQEGDYGLPYSDPIANAKYNHELKRDKKDNITKDIVTGALAYMNFQPIEFDYEYEYW